MRDKYVGLKARVIETDVQVVGSFITEWAVNDAIARVCAREDDKHSVVVEAPVEFPPIATLTSTCDIEAFDETVFCKVVTDSIISESTKSAINKTVHILNGKVKDYMAEVQTLKDETYTLRADLQSCMDDLKGAMNETDSLKEENRNVTSALRECQQLLFAAESSYKKALLTNEEIRLQQSDLQRRYDDITSELEALQRFVTESNCVLDAMRIRETHLLEELQVAKTAASEKGSPATHDNVLCEYVASLAISKSVHNVVESQLLGRLRAAEERISELNNVNAALKESSSSVNPSQHAQSPHPIASTSPEREGELLKAISEKESELGAVNTRLLETQTEAKSAKDAFTTRESELLSEIASVRVVLEEKEMKLREIALDDIEKQELSQQAEKKVIHLQAVARGYIARATTKRMRITQAAKVSGVLVALKHTVQGSFIVEWMLCSCCNEILQARLVGTADRTAHCTTLFWTR